MTTVDLLLGMLSEPLAFVHAGWITGTALIIFYGFTTCYTAKLLANFITSDPRMRTYSDIGRKAFGPRSSVAISLLFCLELFAVRYLLLSQMRFPASNLNTASSWSLFMQILLTLLYPHTPPTLTNFGVS